MAAMVVTTQHKYARGDLRKAMEAMAAEANRVDAEGGYMLLGFQVVETERTVVGLYRKVGRPSAESGASPLVGD